MLKALEAYTGMSVNVLMLGWELPPYNSGGLGTACLGMTEGLARQDVSIKFVVPKVFGEFPFDHMQVLSAADYAGDDDITRLLQTEGISKEDIMHQLAYGAHLTVDEQRRLMVDHLHSKLPVSPHAQATWYSQQATAIANQDPHGFDVVHAHDWFTYHGGMAARQVANANGHNVPFIAHIHATEYDRCGEHGDPRIVAIEKEGLNSADRVIAVSHFTADIVHRKYGVPREKISVVHNGIPSHRTITRHNFDKIKEHHKLVLFMGRVTMQKGPEYFVQLAKAVTDIDPTIRFLMVGSGDKEHECIEMAAKMGLTGKMLFSSFVRGKDVDRAYQLADLFVMPSVSEPFGIVALEAMENGTPALVSKQSGVAEASEHVLKVDFWNIEEMRDQVLNVLHNEHVANRLREGGFHDIKHLTWDTAAVRLNEVYASVLAEMRTAALPSLPQLAFQPATA